MSVIVTVVVPAAEVALGPTVTAPGNVRLELEHVVPVGDDHVPYVRASDHDVDAIAALFEREPSIESFTVVDAVDGEALVRIEWAGDHEGVLGVLDASSATILEAVGAGDSWRFDLRFDDREALTEFSRRSAAAGITLEVRSVHEPVTAGELGVDRQLTDTQAATLRRAYDQGYFEVPREVTLVELADELGVSDSAVSQRLRRGLDTVVSSRVGESDDPSTGG